MPSLVINSRNFKSSFLKVNSPNPITGFYTSKQWDEDVELYYFNARWYDPETGRFITEDPIRDGTGWYSYVGNNPMGFVDPTGLMSKSETKSAAAANHAASYPGAGFGSGESHTSPDKESRPEGGGPKNIGWSYGEDGWTQLKGGIVTYNMLWSDAGIILSNNRNNRKGNDGVVSGKSKSDKNVKNGLSEDNGITDDDNHPSSYPPIGLNKYDTPKDHNHWRVDFFENAIKSEVINPFGGQFGRGVCRAVFTNLDTGEEFTAKFLISRYMGYGSYMLSANISSSFGHIFAELPSGLSPLEVARTYTQEFVAVGVDVGYFAFSGGVSSVHGGVWHDGVQYSLSAGLGVSAPVSFYGLETFYTLDESSISDIK